MTNADCFYLGEVAIHPAQHRVQRNGIAERIEPRLMTLLLRLAAEPGAVISRADLLQAAWPEGCGSDEGLTKAISGLRRALGDNARDARVIETVPKRGYRLVAAVHCLKDSPKPAGVDRPPASPPHGSVRPKRLSLLWGAIALLAVGLIGQWAYLTQDKPEQIQQRVRVHIPLNGSALSGLSEAPLVDRDSLLMSLGGTEGTPMVVRRRVHLPAQ